MPEPLRGSFDDMRRDRAVEWIVSDELQDYVPAITAMEARAEAVARGAASECVWLLEHPALYTAGTSARPQDLIEPVRLPVYVTGRGGQYTYHGPGQRVAYVMLDLRARGGDVRAFVYALEGWIIDALATLNVKGERRHGRVGVWVSRPHRAPDREDKIAALGIRVRRGVAFHGISINVDPDLADFDGIVPCGVDEHGVTSLADLGLTTPMHHVDLALEQTFCAWFAPTVRSGAASP
jgi:lipoyl(octanoyl) transferase